MSDTYFKDRPNLPEYYETADGEKFYTENLAKNHVNSAKLTNRNITRHVRPVEELKETANEIIAKVPEMDLETAQEYLDKENESGKPRKSVVEALSKQIEELNEA